MTASWKDLCLDARDPVLLGRFWAAVTGLELGRSGDDVSLAGPTPGHRIWVNRVDRPKTVKNRLHLDVYAASLDHLVGLGAAVVARAEETGFGWSVLTDPEGGEFCGFLREPARLPAYRLHGIGIDSVDPERIAGWWGEVFGVPLVDQGEHDWWTLEAVTPDQVLTLDFAPVPEPRVGPNRVHWDVHGDVGELRDAGARVLWEQPDWAAMADPEGNEFCVFPVLPDSGP